MRHFSVPQRSRSSKRLLYKKNARSFKKWIFSHQKLFLWGVVCLAIFFCIAWLIQYFFYTGKYDISVIRFSSGSIEQYDDPYIYKAVKTALQGKSYYSLRWGNGGWYSQLLREYPLVKNISLSNFADNAIDVLIDFHQPTLVFDDGNRFFASYNEKIYHVHTGNAIIQGMPYIRLPSYLASGSMEGIFYEVSESDLSHGLSLIHTAFPGIIDVLYIPGGKRLILTLSDKKTLIVSLQKNIDAQIKQVQLVKDHLKNYDRVTEIDVGSMKDVVVKY